MWEQAHTDTHIAHLLVAWSDWCLSFLCATWQLQRAAHLSRHKLAAGFHWAEGKTGQIVVDREWLCISNSVFINFLLSFAKATTTTGLLFPRLLWSIYLHRHKLLQVSSKQMRERFTQIKWVVDWLHHDFLGRCFSEDTPWTSCLSSVATSTAVDAPWCACPPPHWEELRRLEPGCPPQCLISNRALWQTQ